MKQREYFEGYTEKKGERINITKIVLFIALHQKLKKGGPKFLSINDTGYTVTKIILNNYVDSYNDIPS